MDTSFIGDRPPLRLESPIRFESVRPGMHIRVVKVARIHDYFGIDVARRPGGLLPEPSEKVIAQGKVVSNEDGVIVVKGADGVTTTLKKSEMKRGTYIYKECPPKFTPFPHDDYWMRPVVEKTN